ncbi:hypothetical protein PR202_gb15578 [Eleusine coracana subsp. coracana]|uniref:AIG1-type G domain-containing protein n=1 Tax=Eleusine coracana subsp. coracana TaxID=191504 RepID=A0AAV5EYP5_ELECO|nr:hypothetical protein PR202_gb15578 [Eleusine coracana subsp. coracana]
MLLQKFPFTRSAMGGGGDGDWVLPSTCPAADITLVLVGKLVLRDNLIFSMSHLYSLLASPLYLVLVFSTGLFDMNVATEAVRKEIVKCMDMSRDGIHAMLMVFSATSRFTAEDAETIESIKMFFGDKIVDHMILVFTYGDQVGEATFETMLTNKDAVYLQRMVKLCGNRVILFDNKTSDVPQQQKQLEKLLDTVDSVIQRNDGKPFSNQMLIEIQEAHDRKKEISFERYSGKDIPKSKKEQYDEYLTEITKLVLEKLNRAIESLQKQLLEEQKERKRSEEEMRKLWERLEKLKWMEDTTDFFQGKKCTVIQFQKELLKT